MALRLSEGLGVASGCAIKCLDCSQDLRMSCHPLATNIFDDACSGQFWFERAETRGGEQAVRLVHNGLGQMSMGLSCFLMPNALYSENQLAGRSF